MRSSAKAASAVAISAKARIARAVAAAALMALAAICLAPAGAFAVEEETHLFNATLSLTGDCKTNKVDLVPDPGCPEGKHPSLPLQSPKSAATDPYGDIYVTSSPYKGKAVREDAGVDVFDPSGNFLTEIALPDAEFAAVDSSGHVYVYVGHHSVENSKKELLRFDPTVYKPQAGEIEYGSAVAVTAPEVSLSAIAVDPSNNHLYTDNGAQIFEYGSAAEENKFLAEVVPYYVTEETPEGPVTRRGPLDFSRGLAIDAVHGRIYASRRIEKAADRIEVAVFESKAPYALIETIDGSTTPEKQFVGTIPFTVSEANGHLFTYDISVHKLYEFGKDGEYVGTLEHSFGGEPVSLGFDNSEDSPNQGYLFVPSGESARDHLYAFEPKLEPHPPLVESVSFGDVSDEDATLRAKVNPEGKATHYALEYVTQQGFEEGGFAAAAVAGEGVLAPSKEGSVVSASATGLSPGTAYRFRARAESQCAPGGCSAEGQAGFKTFASYAQSGGSCENQSLRTGASAALPDCRAYELVTPANTNGHAPFAPAGSSGQTFGTPPASPQGDSLAFMAFGGPVPGLEGAGGFGGDGYVATRTPAGWQSASAGPNGAQSSAPYAGGLSPDHGYAAWTADGAPSGFGPLALEEKSTHYIRYPDGSFRLTGRGSLGTDPNAQPYYLAVDGAHIIFHTHTFGGFSAVKLEPNAPPAGTETLYDRTPDEVTHVVSLLPGDVTPAAGEEAEYAGASSDGSAIAFKILTPLTVAQAEAELTPKELSPLYLRVGNEETLVAAPPFSTFAGLSVEGGCLFYINGGDLYRFDSESQETVRITETGDATVVNIPSQGTAAYFLSPSVLGEGPNPNGEEPTAGKENLYRWDGSAVHFVATVTERDAEGDFNGNIHTDGLGLWIETLFRDTTAADSSRTSPDGTALLFESRANLAGYDSGGKAEVYRYDSGEGTLGCLSCDPTQAKPGAGASLLTIGPGLGIGAPDTQYSLNPNLSPDGQRAFFETSERLVLADNDNLQDVYEWEAQGKGSCDTPGGCLFLISSGQSAHPNYLFGVSESGDDVFIRTTDLLLPAQDPDETPSVYDARALGGIAPPSAPSGECLGEACQPAALAPDDPTPASSTFQGQGNVPGEEEAKPPPCPKGKRLVRSAGKSRCVAAHKHHHKRKRSRAKGRAGR